MIKKYNIAIISLILVIVLAFAIKFAPMFFMKPQPMPSTNVSAVTAKEEDWSAELIAIGSLDAYNSVIVANEIDGRVVKIMFNSGQNVAEKATLVQLNDDTEQANLKNNQALYKLAELNLQRTARLFQNKVAAQADLDQKQASLDQAKAAIDLAKAAIDKKNIRAPFAGTTGINQIKLGQYIQPGTSIVSLTELCRMHLNISRPEKDRNKLSIGQVVKVSVEAYPDQEFKGTITAIDPQIDVNTRNVQIQVTLDNEQELLVPGMFAEAKIVMPIKQKVVTVPETAVDYSLYGDIVYIIEETTDKKGEKKSTVKAQFVETGEKYNNKVIITKGLKVGEQIVANGQVKVKDGDQVAISQNPLPEQGKPTSY